MKALGEFILEHHEPYRAWERDIFDGWLAWNVHNGFVIRAVADDESTAGIGIVRPVMKAEDAQDRYEFDPEGSVLFVDLLICQAPLAMQAIGLGVLQRFGMREAMAWRRPPFNVTETHSAARLRRHIFGKELTYGRRRQ